MTMVTRDCPACGGKGTIIRNPCTSCGGRGRKIKKKDLRIVIPAGVNTGEMLPVKGEGEPGVRGGPYGDLYIQFKVKPHPVFERRDYNTFCDVPITYAQATLGADIEIPTIDGKVTTRIKEGTQPFDTYTIRGKGIPVRTRPNTRGDHTARFVLEVPMHLSESQ